MSVQSQSLSKYLCTQIPLDQWKLHLNVYQGIIDCIDLYADNIYFNNSSGSSGIINATKADIDSLIADSLLIPGSFYSISGVDPTLYNDGTNSGTTVLLQALTSNKLSQDGYGMFWNPKYDKNIDGFGIYNRYSTIDISVLTGTFDSNEIVTADNGATGILTGNAYTGYFIALTGDWTTAVSITGDNSGATANVSNIVIAAYNINDIVFWGGYAWINITGDLGYAIDELELSSEWEKINYNDINYAQSFDVIRYDQTFDAITRRFDYSNNVEYSNYVQIFDSFPHSPIAVFQFGNPYDDDIEIGVGGNSILDSYVDTINYYGVAFAYNKFDNYSQNFINFYRDCYINYNIGSQYTFIQNINVSAIQYRVNFQGGYFAQCVFVDGTLYNTSFLNWGCAIINTQFQNGGLINVLLSIGAFMNNCIFTNSSIGNTNFSNSQITDVICNNTSFGELTLTNYSTIQSSTFTNCDIKFSTFSNRSDFVLQNLNNKNIYYLFSERVFVNIDLDNATTIYQTMPKHIMSSPDETVWLSYVDDTGTQVIVLVDN
jgi:hypothetical protein